MSSKVSVVMPCYNAEKYISEAIDSILHQTYSNWELIIVDDASTDRSAELIQAYVRRDLRISAYVNQEKKGAGAARNLAISHCTGKYVAFLDADDISNRKRLEKQADFLDKNKNYGAVGTQAKLVDQDSRIMGETKNPSAWCSIKKVMLFRCPFVNSSMMFRKCMVDKYGVWMNESMSFGEDYLFWINMSEHCRMHNLKEYLTLYRINTNGLSYQWINKMKISEQCCDGHLKLYQVLWDRKGLNTDKYNTNALVNALSGKNIESIFEFFVNLRNVVRYGMTICGNKYDDIIVQEMLQCIGKMIQKLKGQYRGQWYLFQQMRECIAQYGNYPYPKYMVLEDKKLIYLEVTKVANCSIKASMLKNKFKDDYSVQRESLKYTVHNLDNKYDDYYKFTFVRNPFERIVSCYESKYHKDRQMLGNILTELEYDHYLFGYIRRDRGFANFLCRIALIPDSYKDHHFKPQYSIVYDKNGRKRVDYIGKYENLNQEYGKISRKYGLDRLDVYNKTDRKTYMEYYNRFTVYLAYFIYKKDIKFFEYEKEYQELLDYVNKKRKGVWKLL